MPDMSEIKFCFLCFQWFDSLKSWQSHAAEHVQSNGGTSLLPLKCDVVHFRHNLIRPGLCPECLGDDDEEPQNRFQQHTNVSEWKTHVLRHIALRRHHQCRPPHCTKSVSIDSWTEFFHHLADVHQIRFSNAEKQQVAQNSDAAKRPQQPQVYKRRKSSHMSRTRLKIEPKGDKFKNHTSRSMKRQLETRRTGKSPIKRENPSPRYDSPEHIDRGQSIGEESLWINLSDPAEAQSNKTTIQDNSTLLGAVPQIVPLVEDAHADKKPRRSARLSVLGGFSHGAPRRNTPLPNDDKEGRRNLVKLVVPRPQRATSNRPGHFCTGAVDSDQSEADILDLSVSPIPTSRRSVKRQARIMIEVPPRPIDWWTWKELPSPLVEKVPERPSVRPREEDLESKERQPQTRLRGRPRGRPRRNEPRPFIQRHHSKPAQRCKSRSTNSSKHCKQGQSTTSTNERALLTRKRSHSATDGSFDRELVDSLPSSHQTQPAMPLPLIIPKKMRLTTSTNSSYRLSPTERPDVLPLLHGCHKVPIMLNLDGESATSRLAELQWHQNEDTSLHQTSDWHPNTNRLYSAFLHSCDSPILQASTFGMHGGETTSDQPSRNAEEASEQIEDDATIDSLFDQYLHPTSFSASFSTPDPTEGRIDETSRKNLSDLEDKDPGGCHGAIDRSTRSGPL